MLFPETYYDSGTYLWWNIFENTFTKSFIIEVFQGSNHSHDSWLTYKKRNEMEKIDKKGAYIRLANKNYRTPTEVFTPFLTKKLTT